MKPQLPAIISACERLQTELEQAIQRWARENRITHGLVIRQQAMLLVQAAYQWYREKARKLRAIRAVDASLQNLIQTMQLGHRLKSFASFDQFEMLIRQAEGIGGQVNALTKFHLKNGQNSAQVETQQKRAETLSAHSTPAGVNA